MLGFVTRSTLGFVCIHLTGAFSRACAGRTDNLSRPKPSTA